MARIRVGIGFDVHPFAPGRRLMLGGVEVPHLRGLAGHSDADVLLHALSDALLGAAALGDLGQHFPASDPRYAGADSKAFLAEVVALLKRNGWRPSNVDCTVIAQEPRLAAHFPAMRAVVARLLGLDPGAVSVKAKTTEELGFIGREEGIAAQAVALIEPVE